MTTTRHVVALIRRNLIHTVHEPLALSDVTFLPVFFTVLFVYVFGSGENITGGSYPDFAIPGLMLLNLTTASMTTAVGLSTDLSTGVVARFRTLPIRPGSVLFARSLSDIASSALCLIVVAATGWVVGWRPHAGVVAVVAGFGIALLFSYALSWFSACLGVMSPGPESAQGVGLVVFFPLALVSNSLVPTQGMPGWMQVVANWSPVSTVTSALRTLFGNPNPSAELADWPMRHPILGSLAWAAVLLAVCVPSAFALYHDRTRR